MTRRLALGVIAASVSVAALGAQQPPVAPAPLPVPKTTGALPSMCAQEVRDVVSAKQRELQAALPPGLPPLQPGQQRSPEDTKAAASRNAGMLAISQQIPPLRLAMNKDCAARFDGKTYDVKVGHVATELMALAQIYADAQMPDRANETLAASLAAPGQTPESRVTTLASAISMTLRQPKGDERNARIEKMVDELDAMPDTFLDQKFAAHLTMNGFYRADDIDAGIIKHSDWLIAHIKTAPPDLRKKYARGAVSAYINKGQAIAGQGKNDEAIALMNRAPIELPDVPTAAAYVKSEVERLQLVGTLAAPLTAPRWLNMPAGKKTLDMTGSVTLLEFSAWWCGPCKESYPGVNRLRAKYGAQGFRVVLATELYGYFEQEGMPGRTLPPDVEFARDRDYFPHYGLDVPIAVGDMTTAASPNPNNTAYKVGGIPQIHLVDKKGKIRLVMVGYDDANEAKLAKMIEELLKEK